MASRQLELSEAEELLAKKTVGPLQGFRSKMGRPFAAIIKLGDDLKPTFDFGQDNGENAEPVDFTGHEPVGKCPKCGSQVFEHGMNYICEKSTGEKRSCDFRTGKIILQQPIERDQAKKLLETGKTDLLTKFVSKRNNRTFKAFLKLGKGGKVEFEFEPRAPKEGRKPKSDEPRVKLDFTGQEPLGKCPKCGGNVFESETDYLCERSQNDTRRCTFKIGKTILQRAVPREQAIKILRERKSDVMNDFISKAGKPFPAWLVLDEKGKVTFEFPPREGEVTT